MVISVDEINVVERYIILLLGVKDFEFVQNRAYLQREMYVLSHSFKELSVKTCYKSYFLGPYSVNVSDAITTLTNLKLIRMKTDRIELTVGGKHVFNTLKNITDEQTIQKIAESKVHLNDLSMHELSAIIHFSYLFDNNATKTLNDDDVLKSRRQIAVSLYQKNKVGAQKAADIAGESLKDFLENFKTANYQNAA